MPLAATSATASMPERAYQVRTKDHMSAEKAEAYMPEHKFAVGQMVSFSPDQSQIGAADRGGSYKVVRLLPEAVSVLRYRVQCELDGHERVVREDQLA